MKCKLRWHTVEDQACRPWSDCSLCNLLCEVLSTVEWLTRNVSSAWTRTWTLDPQTKSQTVYHRSDSSCSWVAVLLWWSNLFLCIRLNYWVEDKFYVEQKTKIKGFHVLHKQEFCKGGQNWSISWQNHRDFEKAKCWVVRVASYCVKFATRRAGKWRSCHII